MTASAGRAQTAAAYDRLAGLYDVIAAPFERSAVRAGLGALAAQPSERVLDLGCGTGQALAELSRAARFACGVDLSARMCRVARGRGVVGRADATALPFRSAAFDAALMTFALELFSDAEVPAVLAELRRVLRPGGRLAVVSMARRAESSVMTGLYAWANRRFPHLVDCRPIDAGAALREAGLEGVQVADRSLFGLAVSCTVGLQGGGGH